MMNEAIRRQEVPSQGNATGVGIAGSASGERSTLADLLSLMGADAGEARLAVDVSVPVRRVSAGDTLFHEGVRAESIYFVRTGTFKIFRTTEEGYEQVLGFVGRAELLGFDAVGADGHPSAAVALEDSSAYMVLVRDILSFAGRVPALARVVHRAISSALTRNGEIADVMAAVAAEVRLARFLMHLSLRMAACGQSPRRFHLRMTRRDIASYLGVAHETVSRSFSALAGWGLVGVSNREVEILDMDGLRALARSTRRPIDESGHPTGPGLAFMRLAARPGAAAELAR